MPLTEANDALQEGGAMIQIKLEHWNTISVEFAVPVNRIPGYFMKCDPANPAVKPWLIVHTGSLLWVSAVSPEGDIIDCHTINTGPAIPRWMIPDSINRADIRIFDRLVYANAAVGSKSLYTDEWNEMVKEVVAKMAETTQWESKNA